MDKQLTLIETDLAQELTDAFEDWCATNRSKLGRTSTTTYRHVWHSFAQFLIQIETPLQAVSVADLELFLHGLSPRDPFGEEINERYAWRALSLIKRVSVAQAKRDGEPINPAAQTLLQSERFRYTNARGREPLPEPLDPSAARELIKNLVSDAGAIGLKPTWKLERDRASLALMLGSGLTPMELRQLNLRDLSFSGAGAQRTPWKIRVQATSKTVSHDAPIAGWARRCLKRWLKIRDEMSFSGDVLLPATSRGGAWTDVGCQAAVTKALLLLLDDSHRYGGLLRLRHTFVIRQMRKGASLQKIAGWLGIRDIDRLQRYNRVMTRDEWVA